MKHGRNMGTTDIRPMATMPEAFCRLLYMMRLYEHRNIPYDEYLNLFDFVTVDGVAYCTPQCDSRRIWEYRHAEGSSYRKAALPDAIIVNGYVLKNRYGKCSI